MTVPEAAMNEHNSPVARKDQIWRAGQNPLVETESVPERVRSAPDQKLRRRVSTPNAGHASCSLFWTEVVHHGMRFYS